MRRCRRRFGNIEMNLEIQKGLSHVSLAGAGTYRYCSARRLEHLLCVRTNKEWRTVDSPYARCGLSVKETTTVVRGQDAHQHRRREMIEFICGNFIALHSWIKIGGKMVRVRSTRRQRYMKLCLGLLTYHILDDCRAQTNGTLATATYSPSVP